MATASKKEVSISEKLESLFELQKIDSEIDRIRTIRGELPLEVSDLEDEIGGLETRVGKIQDEITESDNDIAARKNSSKDSETAIGKYKERQNNVRNNREFESLSKEIEYQELEIKLHEKRSKETKLKIEGKKEILDEAQARLEMRKSDLSIKQKELDDIVKETQKDEDKLMKASEVAKKNIEERLIFAYTRLRNNAKNGLAVVQVMRGSCGGCFNKIPPQRQLDIVTKKKILVCEHCGRILVPATVEEEA
jgi:predicted  nucleic acid-binding Zn-ribbon protein